MSLKLVTSNSQPSRTKACALAAFRLIRTAQAKAAQVPGVLAQARNDVVSAWREPAVGTINAEQVTRIKKLLADSGQTL